MSPWGYIKHSIANAGSGAGRASRAEYAAFFVFAISSIFAPILISAAISEETNSFVSKTGNAISLIFGFLLLIPLYALAARRSHDIGWSGWWAVFNFWPVLLLVEGEDQANKFGTPPRSERGMYWESREYTFIESVRAGLKSLYWLF